MKHKLVENSKKMHNVEMELEIDMEMAMERKDDGEKEEQHELYGK